MRTGRLGPIGWLFVVAIVLAVGTLAVDHAPRRGARVGLWGDSLAWEAGGSFSRAVLADHRNEVLVRTWGGTAPCDWLTDIRDQVRRWRPTVVALAFSGNQGTACMQGRDLITAYRQDVTEAVRLLTDYGADVILVEAPPRRDQEVDAAGLTPLDRVWREIAASWPRTRVAPAGRAVTTATGHFTPTLPCVAGETCGPGGQVTVRSPDGVHFCPKVEPPMVACPVVATGAVRYGTAIARAALALATGKDPRPTAGDSPHPAA